jgi:hypothetical protein
MLYNIKKYLCNWIVTVWYQKCVNIYVKLAIL